MVWTLRSLAYAHLGKGAIRSHLDRASVVSGAPLDSAKRDLAPFSPPVRPG